VLTQVVRTNLWLDIASKCQEVRHQVVIEVLEDCNKN
jgi:hypothetical protein